MNVTNTTNGSWVPPMNVTNTTNGSWVPPMNVTNTTNGTNDTWVLPTNNITNTTNNTVPLPSNTTNTSSTNTTNTTSTKVPYQDFQTNATDAISNTGMNISSDVTIAPPPPITSAVLATLKYSPNEGRFLGSSSADCLRITQSGGNTLFTIDVFNRQQSDFLTTYTYSHTGLWNFVASSKKKMTCALIHSPSLASYAFLHLSSTSNNITISNIVLQSSLTAPFNAMNLTQMADIHVGDNCDLIRYDSTVYSVGSSFTPISSNVKAYSSDLYSIVSIQSLLSYSITSRSYSTVQTLSLYNVFSLESFQDRVVVWGSNVTFNNVNSTYDLTQTVWILNSYGSSIITQWTFSTFLHPTNIVKVRTSPELTKLHLSYRLNASSSQPSLYLYHVNYESGTLSKLIFQNEASYQIATANLPTFDASSFFIGDYYLLVRNQSGINNVSTVAGESTFQFMGETLIPLRYRELSSAQVATSCLMARIDASLLEELVVLDLYYNGDSSDPGFNIFEFSFGNLASTIRVVPPTIPSYISFSYPTNTDVQSSTDNFQWNFLNNAGGNTNMTIYTENEKVVNHLQVDLFQWSGNWQLLASSEYCRLVKNTDNNTIVLYMYSWNSTSFLVNKNVDLTSLGFVGSQSWKISSDCTKIKANLNYFAYNGLSFQAVGGTSGLLDVDSSLHYGVTTSSVLRFNNVSNQYQTIYGLTLSGNAKISSYSNRIIVADVSSTTASFYSLLDNTGSTSLLFSFSTANLLSFNSTPTVQVSEQCTKVLIYGMSSGSFISYFYYLDYSGFAYTKLDFPTESVTILPDPTQSFISLKENWIYVRQLIGSGSQEIVYAIVSNTVPVEADRRNITTENLVCDQYKLRVIDNGTLYVLSRCTNVSTSPIVKRWQILPNQASGGSGVEEMGLSQVVVDGKVKLCAPGCSDCSTGICTACMDGYVYDSNSAICYQCPAGCTACDPENPNSCSGCLDGSFLLGTECLICDPTCTTCQGSATSCQSCLPGQYFNGVACTSCSRNCLNCTSASTCDACRKGFVPYNGECRKCSQQCSSCEASNIMYCTSCSLYLYLSAGSCLPCPTRCQKCNGATCAKCDSGYHPSIDGTSCVENCQLPCATCADNNPTQCLSCFYGSNLVGSTCQLDLICNLDSSCTDCGQGSGFVLAGATCVRCGAISNCKQCKQTNPQACAICSPGYFINGTKCSQCPAKCPTCLSSSICTSCSPGYTIPNSAAQGNCISCTHPCLTCSSSSTYCTSCVDGFTKKNWMCQNNVNVGFSFTLNANDVASILTIIDTLVTWLLGAMKLDTSRVEAVTFTSITLGSVTVGGEADPNVGSSTTSTSSTTSATSDLSAALTGASIGPFGVTSSSVVTNGVTAPTIGQEESSNLGLIIGLSVGIPIAIIILIIVIYLVYKRNKQMTEEQVHDNVEKDDGLGMDPKTLDYFHKGPTPVKEGVAIMELELGEMESVSHNTVVVQKDEEGFSEYVQANPRKTVMEPEIVSESQEEFSPTPIMTLGDHSKTKQSIEVEQLPVSEEYRQSRTRSKGSIKKIAPPPGSRNSSIIHVQPVEKEKISMPEEDEFGEFVEEKKKESPKKQTTPLVYEEDFGDYVQNVVSGAPMAELGLPDEESEFGEIHESNPSKVAMIPPSQAPKKPTPGFEIEIDADESEESVNQAEKESENSRY